MHPADLVELSHIHASWRFRGCYNMYRYKIRFTVVCSYIYDVHVLLLRTKIQTLGTLTWGLIWHRVLVPRSLPSVRNWWIRCICWISASRLKYPPDRGTYVRRMRTADSIQRRAQPSVDGTLLLIWYSRSAHRSWVGLCLLFAHSFIYKCFHSKVYVYVELGVRWTLN